MYDGYTYTDMKTLLSNLKALTKKHMDGTISTNLKGLKTLKRGLLSATNTIFPAITFIPQSETIGGYRNGGIYRVDRDVNIEIFVKLNKVGDTATYLQELAHYVKNMFDSYYDDWNFEDNSGNATVFSFSPGSIQYEVTDGADSIIQAAILPYTFSSWEQAPTFIVNSTITEYDFRSIGEFVHDTLREDTTLTQVKFFFSHATPPTQVGQGVIVSTLENRVDSNRREAGRDNPNGYLDILVWTKASPFEGTLDLNLEIVEKIKDVIQENQNMGGRCYRSYISGVDYGVNQQDVLYASRIRVETWAYKNLPTQVIATETGTYYKITRGSWTRFLWLNSTYNGYVIGSVPPTGFTLAGTYDCMLFDAYYPVYAFMNMSHNGLAFSTVLPDFLDPTLTIDSLTLTRNGVVRYMLANQTYDGVKISDTTNVGTYYTLTREGTTRYLWLNSIYTGYVIGSSAPAGFTETEEVEVFRLTGTPDVYVYLNSTYNGLAFSTTLPTWATTTPTEQAGVLLERDYESYYMTANSTSDGVVISE